MTVPAFPALLELDAVLERLQVSRSRRFQFGMVRSELAQALDNGALPAGSETSLHGLLQPEVLDSYVTLAASGALRARMVDGHRPHTSLATNAARLSCLEALRQAKGVHSPATNGTITVEARAIPHAGTVAALRKQVTDQCGRVRSAGHARFNALIALVLDTAARAGELHQCRITDLDLHRRTLRLVRQPQHGSATPATPEHAPLTAMSLAALADWLPVREQLLQNAHGTSRLWVSLRPNHSGQPTTDSPGFARPAGMPLELRGLLRSYADGRHRYDPAHLLPPKLEQLRRAVTALQQQDTLANM
ncbi:hypothetical protein AB0M29_31145 [Streptomyces sp. NPDC051976]|uniref:hypothetical protein n=1 Tax=Streptomyces sp. NPDC051976 TaxID=3154947 RepID=UPI003435C80D